MMARGSSGQDTESEAMKENGLKVVDRAVQEVKKFSKPDQLLSWYGGGLGGNNEVRGLESVYKGLACSGGKGGKVARRRMSS